MGSSAQSRDINTWLLGDGLSLELAALVDGLGHRLFAGGMPVDRLTVSFALLNPSVIAAGMVWRPCEPLQFTRYAYSERDTGIYEHSPFKVAHDTGRWVDIDLTTIADDAFGIIPELKAAGLVNYIVIPMPDSSGRQLSITIATRRPGGFVEADRALLLDLIPALRAVVEIKTLRGILRDVLSAYVGRTPAREILHGSVHRGQVTEVRAAILVADLRGFTHISTRLPPASTAEVINRYYDVIVPAIETHGGEVLKFIGDAVLAIFPVDALGEDGAALAALEAVRVARAARIEPFEIGGETIRIAFGVAIHVGDAVYGNVGSGDRLDFTVIGRDVNIAARIASLCSRLSQDVLISTIVADIASRHGQRVIDVGAHDVRGLARPLHVYVPDGEEATSHADDGVSVGPALVPAATLV